MAESWNDFRADRCTERHYLLHISRHERAAGDAGVRPRPEGQSPGGGRRRERFSPPSFVVQQKKGSRSAMQVMENCITQ